ncbi:hypothetical protein TanjilG_01004 [Lupinus angustifolius]|uniref:AP2/ERF domain-containing protein n=1 Tax=Lupinus angustifolius TaxID=3871 RepID=A0A4P1QR56_LUPAN|nr:PREDICTED: ethylene-responsive transcription factor RAP2-10-like [Lupinus angustifolius]OIV92870.1 hypothetical protein TanjilG_01004 [Lupinus angustifolius]
MLSPTIFWPKAPNKVRNYELPSLKLVLGTSIYSTPVAAARAYDTAVFYLRGPSARLNFPDLLTRENGAVLANSDMSAAFIRKKATEVGARVDALQATHHHRHVAVPPELISDAGDNRSSKFANLVDLNKIPEPENSDYELGGRE